jgi:hypothetical protein
MEAAKTGADWKGVIRFGPGRSALEHPHTLRATRNLGALPRERLIHVKQSYEIMRRRLTNSVMVLII